MVVWDLDPELWRELVAWLAGYGGVVDEVGEGGVFGARDRDWVALFDAVDFEEEFWLRRSVCVVCLLSLLSFVYAYLFYRFRILCERFLWRVRERSLASGSLALTQ